MAASLGGFWPGLLATVVSTFGATYFFVKPTDSSELTTLGMAQVLGSGRVQGLAECHDDARLPKSPLAAHHVLTDPCRSCPARRRIADWLRDRGSLTRDAGYPRRAFLTHQ